MANETVEVEQKINLLNHDLMLNIWILKNVIHKN